MAPIHVWTDPDGRRIVARPYAGDLYVCSYAADDDGPDGGDRGDADAGAAADDHATGDRNAGPDLRDGGPSAGQRVRDAAYVDADDDGCADPDVPE